MTWQRLEGSGVGADLTPGLAAPIADALWLLARQWQVGEFAGEDAASPVEVFAEVAWHPLGEMRVAGGKPEPINPQRTLVEARIEAEDVHHGPGRTRLAAESALLLLRMAGGADAGLLGRLQHDYPLAVPDQPGDRHGRLAGELLAARCFDGEALADALRAGQAPDPAIRGIAPAWLAAVDAGVTVPPDPPDGTPNPPRDRAAPPRGGPAWNPSRLEYSAELAAPGFAAGTVLTARGYPGGHLDWPAFDADPAGRPQLPEGAATATMATVPVPLRYPGMPGRRWWEFEDGAVDWGDIQGGPADLARYLVAAFATLYGDDWSEIPIDLPRGVLAQMTRVMVADSFGHRFPVQATAVGDARGSVDPRPWRFCELKGDPGPAAGFSPLLLVPAALLPPHDRGRPVEEVLFLRDEVANLGWAVERVVESAYGRRVLRDSEAGPGAGPQATGTDGAPEPSWLYRLATPVPAHYVPLVPVTVEGTGALRWQRGRLATATGATGARGVVLLPDRRLLLHEEEIPSTGIQVTRAYEYARSPDGGVQLWLGRRKRPGRTPRAPGLRHDVVTPPAAAADTGVEDVPPEGS